MLLELAIAVDLLEDFRDPPQDADLVGLGGSAGVAVESMLDIVLRQATERMADITRGAVKRLLARYPAILVYPQRLYTDSELAELTELFASVNATANLLGRALIRDYARRKEEEHGAVESLRFLGSVLLEAITGPVSILTPQKALDYFLNLVPTLGVDPLRFGQDMRRHAFTMAEATDTTLLQSVQQIIQATLRTGKFVSNSPKLIAAVMDEAGVSSRNPQYAEMVFRTNAMDSYNTGAYHEVADDPDMVETFPVWKYSNPDDTRSRPTHAEKNGNYYPASVPFVVVRGTTAADACNCRCVPIWQDKWTWAALQGRGVRLAA